MGTVAGVRRPTAKAQQLRREATPAERKLWRHIGASKLGHKFSRQMPVGPYIVDFLCRSAGLAIEIDGYSHDLTIEKDRIRQAWIESRGIKLIRFSNGDVLGNVEGAVEMIREVLAQSPPPAPPASGRGEA